MQAQQYINKPFVTRIKCDTNELIKVVLDDFRRIYHQEYKGIKFFVYRATGEQTWDSIEEITGMRIQSGYTTKKECIQKTKDYIDGFPDIQKQIDNMAWKNKNCRICTEEEMNQQWQKNFIE